MCEKLFFIFQYIPYMDAKLAPLNTVLCLAPLMVKFWPFDKTISQGDTSIYDKNQPPSKVTGD